MDALLNSRRSAPLVFRSPRWHRLVAMMATFLAAAVIGNLVGWLFFHKQPSIDEAVGMLGSWTVFLTAGWLLPQPRLELSDEGFTVGAESCARLIRWAELQSISVCRHWFRRLICYEFLPLTAGGGKLPATIKKKYLPVSYGVPPERLAGVLREYWRHHIPDLASVRDSPKQS